MPVPNHACRALSALGLLTLAFPTFASAARADPSIANPASYEEISRPDGPTGGALPKTLITPQPVFASDAGVAAAYTDAPGPFQLAFPPQSTIVRNTVTNRSRTLGPSYGKLVEADRTETTGLFLAYVTGSDGSVTRVFNVAPLDGSGPPRDLHIASQYAQVHLSGNGKFIVTSDNLGLRRLNLATGVWTTIAPVGYLGDDSVSDDGQTIAAVDFNFDTQVISAVLWQGTRRIVLADNYQYAGPGYEPIISADGTSAFTAVPGGDFPAPTMLTAYNVRSGRSSTTTLPFTAVWSAKPVWVSPSGDRIAWALGYQDRSQPVEPAKVFNVDRGSWSTFGGPYATSIAAKDSSNTQATVISRNGEFAALAYNRQVALVNLDNRPLVGNILGNEALSPSSYIDTPGLDYCGFGSSSSFFGVFTRPADWVKAPRKAHITVSTGSTVLADADWTTAETYPNASNQTADAVNAHFPLGTAHNRTVKFFVTDGEGRKLSETDSQTVTCGA